LVYPGKEAKMKQLTGVLNSVVVASIFDELVKNRDIPKLSC
jgi:hypothetical protein